jgi:hypothetical protein
MDPNLSGRIKRRALDLAPEVPSLVALWLCHRENEIAIWAVIDNKDLDVHEQAHEILDQLYDVEGLDNLSLDIRVIDRPRYTSLQMPVGFIEVWSSGEFVQT